MIKEGEGRIEEKDAEKIGKTNFKGRQIVGKFQPLF